MGKKNTIGIQSGDRHGSERVTLEDSEIIHRGGNKVKPKRKKYGNQGGEFKGRKGSSTTREISDLSRYGYEHIILLRIQFLIGKDGSGFCVV